MRISGGIAKGIALKITRTPSLRPATEANRERLFSSLGDSIKGARVLDLFAGSGAYGLEALSRGSDYAHFVEKNRKIFYDLISNAEKVRKSASLDERSVSFSNREVVHFLKVKEQAYDLVFLDPPYSDFAKIGKQIFDLLLTGGFVHKDSLMIHEAPAEEISVFANWRKMKVLGKSKKGSPCYRIFSPQI